MTNFLLSIALGAGLLPALIHLLIALLLLMIVYYIIVWVGTNLNLPQNIGKLVLIICALIALYLVVTFLLGIA